MGAPEILLHLLNMHPALGTHAPLMQTEEQEMPRVVTRGKATRELERMASGVEADPKRALHSGRISGATQPTKRGASAIQIQRAGRWISAAFVVYVRAEGEGSDYVSRALTHENERT